MNIDNKIFEDNSISKILLKFALPSIISLLVIEVYNMVDTVFAGRYIGNESIAALTIVFPIQKFFASIGLLVSVGASNFTASYLGRKNEKKLKNTIINAFILMVSFLVFFISLFFMFKKQILTGFGASSKVYLIADKYMTIAIIGCTFQCISMVACYIMNSLGKTCITLYSNILGVILNIILDYIMIVLLHFGIEGAAVSTSISQAGSCIFALYKFRSVKNQFKMSISVKNVMKNFEFKVLKNLTLVGFTTFVVEFSDAITSIVLNKMLSAQGTDSAIITVGVITKISMFIYVTIIGVSSAMQPIAAYNFGAHKNEKVVETLKLTMKTVVVTSVISGSILMLFATPIIGFFLKDAALLSETVSAFRISIAAYPIMGIYYVCIYYYQSVNESKKAFFLSIYGHLIVFIIVLLVFTNIFGTFGTWISYPVSNLIIFFTSIYFIRETLFNKDTSDYKYSKNKYAYSKI